MERETTRATTLPVQRALHFVGVAPCDVREGGIWGGTKGIFRFGCGAGRPHVPLRRGTTISCDFVASFRSYTLTFSTSSVQSDYLEGTDEGNERAVGIDTSTVN